MIIKIILYALAGAFMNSFIRGGFIKKWWPSFRGSKIINALAFGLLSYYHSQNMIYGSLMVIAMMIGQAPAIFDELLDHFLVRKMYFFWAAGVIERALVWSLPLVAASAYWYGWGALWWLLLAPAMVVAYSLCFLQDRIKNQWAISEALFGACMWSTLVLI